VTGTAPPTPTPASKQQESSGTNPNVPSETGAKAESKPPANEVNKEHIRANRRPLASATHPKNTEEMTCPAKKDVAYSPS